MNKSALKEIERTMPILKSLYEKQGNYIHGSTDDRS